MQLDETLFDITEDLNLESWMPSEPMLVSQCMPSEEDPRAIEAQAVGCNTRYTLKIGELSVRQTCI